MLITGFYNHHLFLKCLFIEYCGLGIVVGALEETNINKCFVPALEGFMVHFSLWAVHRPQG